MYENIITHNDFDGVACAALCCHAFHIDNVRFAGPMTITRSEITITDNDIVCDLPYPLQCGLWFDHHAGNHDELSYRGIDADEIPGRFQEGPSCAHVVYDYLKDHQHPVPEYFAFLVAEADIIDSFNYQSIEDWRSQTPGKVVDMAIKARSETTKEQNQFLKSLVMQLAQKPLIDVSKAPDVQERYQQYVAEEQEMIKIINQCSYFLTVDTDQEIIIVDLTRYKRRPHIIRNLAFLHHPRAYAVVEIANLMQHGVKSNNLSVSMSLSLTMNHQDHQKNIGDIMRQLNIGDGHAGAAAGTVYCRSKKEMLEKKENLLNSIFRIWKQQ